LHTPIVVWNTFVGRLRPRWRMGGSSPNQNDYVFVILVAYHKSLIETTDRSGFGGKPSKWRWGRVLSWKILEFCSVGGAWSKNSIFRVFGCPSTVPRTVYTKQFYPKPMVPMESRDSEGVLLVWRVCDRDLADIGP